MKLRNFIFVISVAAIVFGLGKIFLKPTALETTSMHQNQVVLYATDWCGFCKKTREFFKQNNIDFVEYDIEKSEEGKAQYQSLNGRGVPLVLFKGKIIRGYDPKILEALLNKAS